MRLTIRRLGIALAGGCALWLGGCATKIYDVKVGAVATRQPQKTASFRLVGQPGSPVGKANIKDALEVARRALKNKGMREAGDAVTPDVFVVVDCGLAVGATRLVTATIPVFVTVPGRIRQETQQVGTGPGGVPIMQTVTIQDPPTQEVGGYQERSYEIKDLKKFLRLVAYEKNPGDAAPVQAPVWGVQAVFESDDSGLKNVLPVLAAASMVFVGEQTEGQASIRMKDSDRDVSSLRSGL